MYKFHLHENPDYGWQPRLSARDFFNVLSNLTAIKIRGTYTDRGMSALNVYTSILHACPKIAVSKFFGF